MESGAGLKRRMSMKAEWVYVSQGRPRGSYGLS